MNKTTHPTLEMLATFQKMSPQALADPSTHKSEEKRSTTMEPGRLGYIRDYTTQLCGDHFINHCKDPY